MVEKILINKAQCKKCKDVIESKETNDFKRCSCGSIAVDGGLEYIKRLGNLDDIIELSEFDNSLSIRNNLNNSEITIPTVHYSSTMEDIIKDLHSTTELRVELNKLIASNMSFQLQRFREYFYPSYLKYNHYLIENIKPIFSIQTEMISNKKDAKNKASFFI